MEPKAEDDSGPHAKHATSVEELRLKRLAYFNSPERLPTSQKNRAVVNSPRLTFEDTLQSRDKSNYSGEARNKSSQDISLELQKHRSLKDIEKFTEPKKSADSPHYSATIQRREEPQSNFAESLDFESVSVFNSAANLSELGLSTHRPESASGVNGVKVDQAGGCPASADSNSSGSRKMAKDIFGDKTSAQMRSALGDQGFEDLLSKVNKNLSLHREHSAPGHNNSNTNNRAGSTPEDGKHLMREQLSANNSGLQGFQERKEVEQKVRPLTRSYDEMTVPKNTRNSFSADEIYQQAFGGHQDMSVSGSFERDTGSYHNHYYKPSNHASWNDYHQHSYPVDFNGAPKRRFSLDGMAEGIQSSPLHHQLQMAPLACPPMHIPPPGYTTGRSGVPMSPHLPTSPLSTSSLQGSVPPGYFYHGQFRAPFVAHNQHIMQSDYQNQYCQPPSYPPQYVPQSPSSITSHSPSGFHYPPTAYNGSQHIVPRFPHGVPLHLPPPPFPSQLKPGGMQQAYPAAPSSARSLSLHGSEEGMKIPHPPPVPPALKLKEGETEDHRRNATSASLYRSPRSTYHHSWAEEGPPNNYNLQRYFSSMDFNRRGSPADATAQDLNPSASQSVEGDNCRITENKYPKSSPEIVCDGEENDDATSCSSGFTSVTANTMTTGKAGGLTRRLENLGVDLEHLRHLRVVDGKHDQEASDAHFEKLSKGVRVCPECCAANKAYMDWCLGCGEILIGVEPSLPGQRNKHCESSNGNSGKSEKRASRASARENKGVAEQSGVREPSRHSSQSKSQSRCKPRSSGKSEAYTPQESPESGKGLSLSSSPVRYRRDQEEAYEEPKDSGRASSSDNQDRFRSTPVDAQRDSEADSYSGEDDLEVMDEEDFVEEEGVEYDYRDSEPNFFEQIKDPVLREFIISYRNKQIMKEEQAASVEPNPNHSVSLKSEGKSTKGLNDSSEFYDESVKESMAVISKIAGSHTSQFNFEYDPKAAHISSDMNFESQDFGGKTHVEDLKMLNDSNVGSIDEVSRKSDRKKKKKKKHRKKKVEPMDVEIFGYEEIRQSRDSSRASNTHSIPLLNLVGSSEEEAEGESSDETDDSDSKELCSDDDVTEDKTEYSEKISKSSFYNNNTQSRFDEDAYSMNREKQSYNSSPKWKNKGDESVPQPGLSFAPASVSGKNGDYQKSRQPMNESFKGDFAAKRDRVFHASRGGREGEASGYQRHWARSSTAWSSYHPRELSTRSSLNTAVPAMCTQSMRKVRESEGDLESWAKDGFVRSSQNGRASGVRGGKGSRPNSGSSTSSNGATSAIPVRQRPSSAEYSRRLPAESRQRPSSAQVRSNTHSNVVRSRSGYQTSQDLTTPQPQPKYNNFVTSANTQNSNGKSIQDTTRQGHTEDSSASPRLLCPEPHRLPPCGIEDEHADKLHAMAKNSYDKLQQMTPRLSGGDVSIWQCLPDELWLYVFEFVSHADLGRLMQSCQYFYRLANDETLWKYITVRSKLAVNDVHLAAIAQHQPLSLAMVMCSGRDLSQDSLHNFFHETQGRLKELNICGCSHGSLNGALVLQTAAQYCQGLTHLDASYCNLTDASLEAIALRAERLENLCVNGFQSLGDACLLKVLRKHGRSLRTLELYACFSLSASSLRSLGEHCTNLKKLCLGSCNKLTDSAMVTLSAHLARIEELDLRGCKNLKNDCIRKIVRNCPRLNRLVLANCPHISDLALTEIATHLKTTLRTLELCGCNSVTDQGLTTLAKNCDRLVNVDISSTKCSSTSVSQLASNSCSRWLETVKLSFLTPLSEASVINLIRQCPRLKVVHVFGCTSLRNLAKLRQLNKQVLLEGDENFNRFSQSIDDS